MRNRMYGGVRGRKTKVGRKLLRFPPTRLPLCYKNMFYNIKTKVFAFVAKFFLLFSRKSFGKSFVNKKLYIILLRNET